MKRLLLVVLIAVAPVAAACSGDDGDGSAGEVDAGPDDAGDAGEDPEPADSGDPEADSGAEPEPAGEPEEPEPTEALFASFRGVTESTVKVGVAVPDFDALQAAGISNYQGDAEIAFQAFFDRVNDEGGIYGRMIDPVYVSFDFTRCSSSSTGSSGRATSASPTSTTRW